MHKHWTETSKIQSFSSNLDRQTALYLNNKLHNNSTTSLTSIQKASITLLLYCTYNAASNQRLNGKTRNTNIHTSFITLTNHIRYTCFLPALLRLPSVWASCSAAGDLSLLPWFSMLQSMEVIINQNSPSAPSIIHTYMHTSMGVLKVGEDWIESQLAKWQLFLTAR